jgi:hypothetical protein
MRRLEHLMWSLRPRAGARGRLIYTRFTPNLLLIREGQVRYLGTERADGCLNIFLEFVSGGSIASLLSRCKSGANRVQIRCKSGVNQISGRTSSRAGASPPSTSN